MKKIILTLALVVSAQACFAYIEEGKTADVSRLQNAGYSQATLKIIDREQAASQRVESSDQYVRYYSDYKPKNKLSAFWTKFRLYFDPAQEDDFFGRHEMDMNNAWFPDMHDSTIRLNEGVSESL